MRSWQWACTACARMPGHPSASASVSEYRIEKSRVEATLTLSNGTTVRGCFFISRNSRTHAGPEGVRDVLNGEAGFFPFEERRADESRTILYNRDHVLYAAIVDAQELHRDPGYGVAMQRVATMLLANGMRLCGAVRVYGLQGRDRLSDFARQGEMFRYLEAEHATYIVNVRHVVELSEEISVP